MSYTEIYGVESNGDVNFVGQTGNSRKGAMHVWRNLSERYNIALEKLEYAIDQGTYANFENVILKALCYKAIISKVDIPTLLAAFKEYDRHYPGSTLLEQAEIIEETIMKDDNMIGVCWNQTSIELAAWTSGYDEERDEYIPYNILSGKEHNYLSI